MVEIMVTLTVIGLAIAPLFGLLNVSSQQTQTSMSFFLAAQYADEIAQQLFQLGPVIPQIVAEAASGTTGLAPGFLDLLSDKEFLQDFQQADQFFRLVPFRHQGKKLQAYLVLSPLEGHFLERYLVISRIDASKTTHLGTGQHIKIDICLSWRDAPSRPIQKAAFPIILKLS